MMKKLLLFSYCFIMLAVGLSAQNLVDAGSASQTYEFSERNGVFLMREFEPVENKNGIDFENVYVSDIMSGEKKYALRISVLTNAKADLREFAGMMDEDEIDTCLKSLSYIKNNVLASTPKYYSEYKFRTRDGLAIGAFYKLENKGWSLFIQPKLSNNHSLKLIQVSDLDKVSDMLMKSKRLMKEKNQ